MAEVVQDAPQEFWRSPAVLEPADTPPLPVAVSGMAESCAQCNSEYMIGARFCHSCGSRRPVMARGGAGVEGLTSLWARKMAWLAPWTDTVSARWRRLDFPDWLHYLHFHEIKRWIGLPTASLVAFIIGLGCVAGAIGVSLFYRASTLAEFQAIQMWRIEWLLAATAAFVAGILLKKPSDRDSA